jgi:hypothetical protein
MSLSDTQAGCVEPVVSQVEGFNSLGHYAGRLVPHRPTWVSGDGPTKNGLGSFRTRAWYS